MKRYSLAVGLLSASFGTAWGEETPLYQTPGNITLICAGSFMTTEQVANGSSVDHETGKVVSHTLRQDVEVPITFRATLNYDRGFALLNVSEFNALIPSKEDRAIAKSVQFEATDDNVTATFKTGQRLLKALFTLGATVLLDDNRADLSIDRKTGRFDFRGASGECRKAELTENRF